MKGSSMAAIAQEKIVSALAPFLDDARRGDLRLVTRDSPSERPSPKGDGFRGKRRGKRLA